MEAKIKPCPFCGNEYPWTFYSPWHVTLKCKCGATLDKACAKVLYKLDELPEALKGKEKPADALFIIEGERKLSFAEHGYYGVGAANALQYEGILDVWNKRAE